jgi:glycosyltransferase involved in cell wall biosynthesis
VLPSEFEPYGIAISEAQALGIPCIASDLCGCYGQDSVLQHGRSGFVFPCGDLQELLSSIQTLMDDAALYAKMSECARAQGELQSQYHAANGFLAAADYAKNSDQARANGH